jgi:NAD+ kinase
MHIAVIPNPDKPHALAYTAEICRVLNESGGRPVMLEALRSLTAGMDADYVPDYDAMMTACDAVVTVGGDGTIIQAAKHAIHYDRPLIGVNSGRLGFLAELESGEIHELKRLVTGDYTVTPRILLDITLRRQAGDVHCKAVNDVYISRGSLFHMIELDVEYRSQRVCQYRADGLIFATPTGSTAYSLSAGGPVIDPATQCILMTPICPHTLVARPTVFGADSDLTVHIRLREGERINVAVDGEEVHQLQSEDCVTIRQAPQQLKLIQLKPRSFYSVFTAKFSGKES